MEFLIESLAFVTIASEVAVMHSAVLATTTDGEIAHVQVRREEIAKDSAMSVGSDTRRDACLCASPLYCAPFRDTGGVIEPFCR